MAQAAVDLSDPLDHPAESAASTDDLLSQLAGNEIDRLLAEADSDSKPAPKLFKPIKNSGVIPEPVTLNIDSKPADVGEGLDKVLDEADGKSRRSTETEDEERKRAKPEQEVTDTTEREAVFEAAGFESGPAATLALPATEEQSNVVEPGGSEREALLTAAGFDSSGAPEATEESFPEDDEPIPEYVAPLPVYLKPLQFLIAPLEVCPPTLRDLLGKLGIVTLINALAGIAFVMFFRKH